MPVLAMVRPPPKVSSACELLDVAAGAYASHKPIPSFDVKGALPTVAVEDYDYMKKEAPLVSAVGRPGSLGPSPAQALMSALTTPNLDDVVNEGSKGTAKHRAHPGLRCFDPVVRSRSPRRKRDRSPLVPLWATDVEVADPCLAMMGANGSALRRALADQGASHTAQAARRTRPTSGSIAVG